MEKKSLSNSNKAIIFNTDFVASAIIPIIIFYVFNKFNMTLQGVTLSGVWSIGIILFNFVKSHRVNALAIISGIISIIGLIGTLLSKNPTFYLISPIIQDTLISIIFFISLFLKKSLIQVIVEQSYFKNASEDTKRNSRYLRTWRILTFSWGLLALSQAVVRLILLHYLSMSSYYTIGMLYGNISTPLFIAFTIAFPKWYWHRKK
ncbi:VC0807 family protein [Clostridium felsineum]|uniref:VC0807 family protein n=1 Tax=Clostridium felsineum TaxID=36839 RepID=UPI00098CCF03|nr:VC0807 family protein [Clostridium felsineum]URZ18029.1 intracellular septation protein A [Clostridium felsineum DSM 794]